MKLTATCNYGIMTAVGHRAPRTLKGRGTSAHRRCIMKDPGISGDFRGVAHLVERLVWERVRISRLPE